MRTRHLVNPAILGILLGCLGPSGTSFAGDYRLLMPPVREVWFGPLPAFVLLVAGWFTCLGGLWFASGLNLRIKGRPAIDKARFFHLGRQFALPWMLVAVCLVWFFGFQNTGVDSLTRRPASGVRVFFDVIAILASSLLGLCNAIATGWFHARFNAQATTNTPGTMPRGMIAERMSASLELLLLFSIVLLLPQSAAGPGLIGFAIGTALGAAMRSLRAAGAEPANSANAAANEFRVGTFTTVTVIALLAATLAFKPAIATTLVVWVFGIRLMMLLTPIGAHWLHERMNRRLNGATSAGSPRTAIVSERVRLVCISTLLSMAATGATSWLWLGNSASSGSQGYPGLWSMLATLVCCGTLAGTSIPELCRFAARKGRAENPDAAHRATSWNGLFVLTLLFVAWHLSVQPAMARLMPPEIPLAGPFFAIALVAFGFVATEPFTSAATAIPARITAATLGVLAMAFVIVVLLEKASGDGKTFAKLSLLQPEVLFGLLAGGVTGRWLGSARHEDNAAATATLCFTLALAFLSPQLFIACLVSMTLCALFPAADRSGNGDGAPGLREFRLLLLSASFGLLAISIAAAVNEAATKTRMIWVLAALTAFFAYRMARRRGTQDRPANFGG